MHATYQGQSYKSALDVWSSCERLSLEVWTLNVVVSCKAFQVAREAVRMRNSTIADTAVLDCHCYSRATLVEWLGHRYATRRETETSIPTTQRTLPMPTLSARQ